MRQHMQRFMTIISRFAVVVAGVVVSDGLKW